MCTSCMNFHGICLAWGCRKKLNKGCYIISDGYYFVVTWVFGGVMLDLASFWSWVLRVDFGSSSSILCLVMKYNLFQVF